MCCNISLCPIAPARSTFPFSVPSSTATAAAVEANQLAAEAEQNRFVNGIPNDRADNHDDHHHCRDDDERSSDLGLTLLQLRTCVKMARFYI